MPETELPTRLSRFQQLWEQDNVYAAQLSGDGTLQPEIIQTLVQAALDPRGADGADLRAFFVASSSVFWMDHTQEAAMGVLAEDFANPKGVWRNLAEQISNQRQRSIEDVTFLSVLKPVMEDLYWKGRRGDVKARTRWLNRYYERNREFLKAASAFTEIFSDLLTEDAYHYLKSIDELGDLVDALSLKDSHRKESERALAGIIFSAFTSVDEEGQSRFGLYLDHGKCYGMKIDVRMLPAWTAVLNWTLDIVNPREKRMVKDSVMEKVIRDAIKELPDVRNDHVGHPADYVFAGYIISFLRDMGYRLKERKAIYGNILGFFDMTHPNHEYDYIAESKKIIQSELKQLQQIA